MIQLRHAARSLRRNPGFSVVVVLMLALGLGTNCAIFSLVYAAVLRPLPFAQAGRLVFISTGKLQTGQFNSGVSGAEFEEWKPQLRQIFDEYATASGNHDTTWTAGGQAAHLANRDVSSNFFDLLGVRPFAGRSFAPEDEAAGRRDVVLLSYDCWQRQFGGRLDALGQAMRQKGGAYASYTVIGILPASFEFDERTDVWTPRQPLSDFVMSLRQVRRFRVVGRLRPEIRLDQARAAMDSLAAREAQAWPATNKDWAIHVVPLSEHFQANGSRALWLLWAAVGCLLLIACANTANLLLARSGAREREIGVRLALGASRGRLLVQLLTENGLLGLLGGGLGWVVALWSLRLLRYWGSFLLPATTLQDLARLHADALHPAVLAFSLFLSVLSVVAFGMVPARWSLRLEPNDALKGSSAGRLGWRAGIPQMLVAAEVALVMVLAMSAGLLIRSFVKLTAVDPGFRTANRLTFDIELPRLSDVDVRSRRPTAAENRQRSQRSTLWLEELEQRLQSIPGVVAVGASNAFPLEDEGGGWGVQVGDRQLPESTSMAHVTPGYFDAVGAPVVSGSNFGPSGSVLPGAKSLIVNQTMARLLFPGENPIGQHIKAPRCTLDQSRDVNPSDCVIVGIAQDTRFSLESPSPPTFYYWLHQDASDRVTYVVRTNGNSTRMAAAVRTVISQMPPVNSGEPYLFNLRSMDQLVSQSVASPRFRSWLVSLFAVLALCLAAVGIYGVQAHAVTRRTREIGIRMAMGARPAVVFTMVIGSAAMWTLVGIAIGLAGGLAVVRLLSAFLFGVSGWDPVTLVVSPLVLLAVTLAASYVPASRAMGVDPVVALRSE